MPIPKKMTCVEINTFGDANVLKTTTRPVPNLKSGEVLIKISASGVNRPDVFQRQGNYAPPPGVTDIPGLEVAGTVVAKATRSPFPALNQNICALVPGGGYAEFVNVRADHCLPIPTNLSMAEGAALPETFFTVWSNVFDQAKLKFNETFLIHGGSSGIGTTAIQMAKCFGAKVLATAGSREKCDVCISLGAKKAVNYKKEDFVEAAKQFTNGKGINLILDMVGGDYIPRNIKCLAQNGRLINIAFLRGSKYEVNFLPIMLKQLTVTGSTLRPQSAKKKKQIAKALHKRVWPLIEEKKILPVIYKTFPLTEASKAHQLMESNAHIGKIILTNI